MARLPEIEKLYESYWKDPAFAVNYGEKRNRLYRMIAGLALDLKVKTVLDVGCAYGQIVDFCNQAGIDAWGADLAIPELMNQHQKLTAAQGRFVYGSIDDPEIEARLTGLRQWDLVICMHTVCHLSGLEPLRRLNARHYIFKEVCDNPRARHRRVNQHDVRLYSPLALADGFPGYRLRRLYVPPFVAAVPSPPRLVAQLLNRFGSSYIAVLSKNS